MSNKKYHVIGLALLWIGCVVPAFGTSFDSLSTVSPDSVLYDKFIYHFSIGSSILPKEYRNNLSELERLKTVLASDRASQIERVVVVGCVSPEGADQNNHALARARANETQVVLRWKHPEVFVQKETPIEIRQGTLESTIAVLRAAVAQADSVPCRCTLLEILDTPWASPTDKINRIRVECGPSTYRFLERNFFGAMRYSAVYVLYKGASDSVEFVECTVPKPVSVVVPPVAVADTLSKEVSIAVLKAQWEAEWRQLAMQDSVLKSITRDTTAYQIITPATSLRADSKRSAIAIKTNLLFDLATAVNLEVELPIGDRWSVLASAMFPVWNYNNKYCLTILETSLEARFWLGNRTTLPSGKPRNSLTGHFFGIYGNWLANYDLQIQQAGVMGSGYGAGLTYGFAHRLGRNFNMEYSIGVGGLYLNNKTYTVTEDYLYKELVGESSGWHILPTRLKVSFVWLIGNKRVSR